MLCFTFAALAWRARLAPGEPPDVPAGITMPEPRQPLRPAA
jgi:hypothetical protein